MVKPVDFEDVVHMSRFLTVYWLGMSETPESFRSQRRGSAEVPKAKKDQDD